MRSFRQKMAAVLPFVLVLLLVFPIWIVPASTRAGRLQQLALTALVELVFFSAWFSIRKHWLSGNNEREQKLREPFSLRFGQSGLSLEMEQSRLAEFDLRDVPNLGEMQRINLGANNLKSIDLSPLSGNTYLVELILYFNDLESISLSPLSECVNLEYLDLAENNITEIDLRPLSSCTRLHAINIGGNQTQVIDLWPLSSLSELKILTVDKMGLREIDLSPLANCPRLEFLKINDNEIESIDITPLYECKSLTDFEIDNVRLLTTVDRPIEDWPEGIRKHRRKIRII